MKKTFLAAIALGLLLASSYAAAEETLAPKRSSLAVGAGWPEVLVRYGFSTPLDLEIKYALSDGLGVAATRLYWDYKQFGKLGLNSGIEAGYIGLTGAEGMTGSGLEMAVFTGVQYQILDRLSLSADLGPTWLSLNSAGQRVDALEWVIHTGLYLRVF